MSTEEGARVRKDELLDFCVRVFVKMGVSEEDAVITSDVMVSADLRGINSHGVARLRRYVDGLNSGMMRADAKAKVVAETSSTATIDADGGLGHPVSHRAMELAIKKAKSVGSGFVVVRNSNHYGIAGYYSTMALQHDCVGMSMTNSAVLVVPTHGRDAMLGTNPISVAAPAGDEAPFVLDMATSTVPRGKLEVYDRAEEPMPIGWATDARGVDTTEAREVLENLKTRGGGGLLPLGGAGELLRGHKGYGLGLWVEIFTALLSGSAFGTRVYPKTPDGKPLPADIGHFFGAWDIAAFRPVDEFKASLDELHNQLKNGNKADGQDRIYIHGEKETEAMELYLREGIPLEAKVVADIHSVAEEVGVEYDLE